jgi:hypothetical protein
MISKGNIVLKIVPDQTPTSGTAKICCVHMLGLQSCVEPTIGFAFFFLGVPNWSVDNSVLCANARQHGWYSVGSDHHWRVAR